MPLGHPNDLIQRGRVYYFRRAVPCDLRSRVGRKELKVSLKTTVFATAKLRCRKFSNRFEQMMDMVGIMPSLGKEKIEQLIRAFFSDLLSQAEEHAYLLPEDDTVDLTAESDGLKADLALIRNKIATRNHGGATQADAEKILAPFNGNGSGVSEEDFDTICNGILRAKFEQHRILAAMLIGDYQNITPLDPMFEGVKSPGMPPLPEDDVASTALSVSQAIKKFCDLKSKFDWTDKTRIEVQRSLNWFTNFVGQDRKLSTITKDDVKDFRDALLNLPASFSQSKKFKGMTFKEAAAEGTDGKTLSAATVVKYFGGVKGFFYWCEDDGYTAFNPATKLKMPVKGNPNEDRDPFSFEQLGKIFQSSVYTGCKSAGRRKVPGNVMIRDGKFWVPLIGLLSGMRMSEIIQMRVSDIKEQDNVSYFNVTDDASFQSLKTKSSKRVVPVHPNLIRIGFLDHVARINIQQPDQRIFEEMKPSKKGSFSHNFSKAFSRYLIDIGAKTEKTAFHSFRHNFTDALRIAEINDTRQDALLGHASQGVGAQYGSKFTPEMLSSDINKITSPIDLSHLFVKDD